MPHTPLSIAIACACAALATPAVATVTVFNANLTGGEEVPPVATPGAGFAIVTIDDVAKSMRVQVTFSGLLSPTTASHIHCCAPFGTNAGVATQVPSFGGFPLGVLAGSYDRVFDMSLAASFNPAFLNNVVNGGNIDTARATLFNGMIAAQSYLNVHTQASPGGEIRGQLRAVPEPTTWAMMLLGFGIVGAAMRSRGPRTKPRFAF